MSRKSRRRNRRGKSIYVWILIVLGLVVIVGTYLATQAPGGSNSRVLPLSISPQNPVMGSKSASFTIYEFGDFQCPTCDYWFKTQEPSVVQNLVDPGKAKLVWRDFIIYDSDSRLAASAAYAAGEQGKFWQFHDLLYSNQGQVNSGWVTQQLMLSYAGQLGLNLTEFTQSMNSGQYNSLIDSNFQSGLAAGVQGTPTFFVVGPTGQYVMISGAQPESVFQQAITSLGGG
ncbi:MAG TPA: DsbA family protein [Nitrososphaerales archaeon]|nr:DsbA family protein [Nitrososphaerales archaeon]